MKKLYIFISDSTKVSVFENVDSLKKYINDRFILKIKKDKVFKKVFK